MPSNTKIEVQAPEENEKQLRWYQILGLWAAVTLPTVLLTWVITPALIPLISAPAALLYWLILPLNAAWMIGLSLWILRREEGDLSWASLRRRIWLGGPRDPKTGQPRNRYYFWLLPCLVIAFVVMILSLYYQLFSFDTLRAMVWHSFAYVSEVGSPEFAGQWGWLAVVIVVWGLNMFVAEELFFRGVLLPRMRGIFGRLDWLVNAMLYGLFYLAVPFAVPFRFLLALLVAGPARRYRSMHLALAVRSLEGLVVMTLALVGVGSKVFAPFPAAPSLPYLEQTADSGWPVEVLTELPAPTVDGEIDLRSYDLSGMDLSGYGEILAQQASFNSQTVWPPADRMPDDFDPQRILDLGRNPGLGVRSLHARGITGRGVGLAIIDQPLLTNHEEFGGRLRWYESIGPALMNSASMHGPAVSSLAVGRIIGVAPEADLYYFSIDSNMLTISLWMYHYYAQGIRRVLQLNQVLPPEHRIRVISISAGWNLYSVAGSYDIVAAVEEARAQGVLVVYTHMADVYGIGYMGLNRDPMRDPDRFESYGPTVWWGQSTFNSGQTDGGLIFVPMDSRTTADPSGTGDYAFYRRGGLSWATPWMAGIYALAVQADPSLTPERFLELALETGRTIDVLEEGQTYKMGPILDPSALIAALQGELSSVPSGKQSNR